MTRDGTKDERWKNRHNYKLENNNNRVKLKFDNLKVEQNQTWTMIKAVKRKPDKNMNWKKIKMTFEKKIKVG